jgi:nucleotide-binding universal stress UspA family protein
MKWSLDTTSVHLKRILFATDLSRQATTAFKFAAWLSLRFGSKLYLVHAISSAYYAVDAGKVAPALRDVEMKVAHKKLGHYFERMREAGLVDREEIVTSSLPKELIREVVETKRVDLVVMGSHGRGGIGKLALGSVAESAIRPSSILSSPCIRAALQPQPPKTQIHSLGDEPIDRFTQARAVCNRVGERIQGMVDGCPYTAHRCQKGR